MAATDMRLCLAGSARVDLSPELGERDLERSREGAHGRPRRVALAVLDAPKRVDGDACGVREGFLRAALRLAQLSKHLGEIGIGASRRRHADAGWPSNPLDAST